MFKEQPTSEFLFNEKVSSLTAQAAKATVQKLRHDLRGYERAGNQAKMAWSLLKIAMVLRSQRQHAPALQLLDRVRTMFSAINEEYGLASTLSELSCINKELDRNSIALEYSHKAIQMLQKLNRPLDLAWAYDNRAIIHLNLFQRSESLSYLKRARAIFMEFNSKGFLAWNACNLANLYFEMGFHTEALHYFEEALSNFKELKNQHGVAWALMGIGVLWRGVCQFDKAETYINDAQEIFEELDIKDRAAWCLLNRAAIKRSQGVHEQAALLNKKALQYFSPLKNHDGVAWTLFQTGQILHDQGQLTKAWQTIREALNLHSDISNRKGLGWGESEWGQIYMELNDHVHARECFARAKVIGEQLDIVPLKLDVEKNISLYYLDEGQLTKATDLLQKLDIKCEKIESWEINADVLLALAKANAIIGNWPRVRLEIEEAKRLSETYNLARLKPVVGLYLAELLVSEGKPDNAKKILQEVSKLSKDTNQRRQHAEALLGLVQLEKKEKTAAQLSATLDLIEKDVRAISSRKLKAKFLMVRALLNFTVSRSVDVKVISQALQIAESTGLFVLKKQLLDIVSAMYQQDKKERDWSDSQDELRQFLDKNSPDLSLVANRSQFLNSMPVSITL